RDGVQTCALPISPFPAPLLGYCSLIRSSARRFSFVATLIQINTENKTHAYSFVSQILISIFRSLHNDQHDRHRRGPDCQSPGPDSADPVQSRRQRACRSYLEGGGRRVRAPRPASSDSAAPLGWA